MNGRVWIQGGRVLMRGGKIVFLQRCPCDCHPRVIGSKKLNGSKDDKEEKCWDLKPYKKPDTGTPFARWRLIEVGEDGECDGSHYGSGEIDECGRLVGLEDEFCSSFSYDGYMELQEGCYDYEKGKWRWPCPEDKNDYSDGN